jgi:hypothetical protein
VSARPDIEEALLAAREVAQAQRARLQALREALLSGDAAATVRCARAVVGLDDGEVADAEAGDRAAQGQH